MDPTGNSGDGPASAGLKLGFVAALLFVVAASLLWHHVYRDPVALAHSRPDPDRLLIVRIDGPERGLPAGASRPDRRNAPPGTAQPTPRSRPSPPAPATPSPAPEPRKYEVREGDCLSTISSEIYGTASRWRQIADANEMSPPYELREGMILHLP